MSLGVRIEVEHPHDPAGDVLVVKDWLSYRVESDMFTSADAFTMRVAPTAEYLDFFRIPGHPCRIYYGDNLIMTGLIDATPVTVGDHGPQIELTGRDLGGLLDDAAPLLNLTNQSLRMILEKLIAAHSGDIPGIVTDAGANVYGLVGKKVKKRRPMKTYQPYGSDRRFKSTTQPGETIWTVANRLGKHIGMTPWMMADGRLCMSRPNYYQDTLGKLFVKTDSNGNTTDSNVTAMSRSPDVGSRYSDYTCLGQGRAHATSSGKDLAGFKASARDPSRAFWWDSVSRRRQKIKVITVRNTSDKQHLVRYARTEMEEAVIKSYNMTATVEGHEVYPGGPLWAVDTLVDVEFGPKKIDAPHYIRRRQFMFDAEAGPATSLTPIPSDLWLADEHDGFSDKDYFTKMWNLFQRYAL